MSWTDVFLYLVLLGVSLWTARLALSKGRNPWTWGGAALLLSIMPSHLLGSLPLLALLFIKSNATSAADLPDRLSCPRCAKSHSGGQHFCTGCGWDLNLAYSPEEQVDGQPAPADPRPQTTASSTAVAKPPEIAETPAAGPVTAESPISENQSPETAETPVVEHPQEPAGATVQSDQGTPTDAENPEEEPNEEYVPWGTPAIGVAPTASVMVERGMERFDAGKYQEAIDQFTKAIALDPNFAEAWRRRAEAYAQMGRSEQAAEDRRHLQGLDPSSSPG